MNKYLILAIILLLIYCYCYFIFNFDITILQTSLNDFNFNLLYQKQPLIIEDKIIDYNNLVSSWFKQNIIYDNISYNCNFWNTNNFKYLFIYSINDTEILLNKPNIKKIIPDETDQIVSIQLYTNQCLILPFKWKYFIENNNDLIIIGIHDYIT